MRHGSTNITFTFTLSEGRFVQFFKTLSGVCRI